MRCQFQSTHPRGVRPARRAEDDALSLFQSTHPRGVRHDKAVAAEAAIAFQSTHPRGVRRAARVDIMNSCMFQSTHPRGVRLRALDLVTVAAGVSIHAPAWGATTFMAAWILTNVFQSTHPRGVRRGPAAAGFRAGESFNPRTRVGCDLRLAGAEFLPALVSIHAPAWGATHGLPRAAVGAVGFQSTHPRGVRLFPCFIQ